MDIVPLSQENLEETIDLTIKIFGCKPSDSDFPGFWMPSSLNHDFDSGPLSHGGFSLTYLKYYVAVIDSKVVGVSGVYCLQEDDFDTDWVAWTCVDKNFRCQKIGERLLDFSIDKAKKRNKKFMKLYTTPNEDIEKAINLYKKKGFEVFKTEESDSGEKVIFMKLSF